jgi:hypothetical protein
MNKSGRIVKRKHRKRIIRDRNKSVEMRKDAKKKTREMWEKTGLIPKTFL